MSDPKREAIAELIKALELCEQFDLPTPFVATSGPRGGSTVAAAVAADSFEHQFIVTLRVSDPAAYYEMEREYLTPRGGKFTPALVGWSWIASVGDDVFIRQEDDDRVETDELRQKLYRVMEELKPTVAPVGGRRFADHVATTDQVEALEKFVVEQCINDPQAPRLHGPTFIRTVNEWLLQEDKEHLCFSLDANSRRFYNVLRELFPRLQWTGAYVDARPSLTQIRGVRVKFEPIGQLPAGGERLPNMLQRITTVLDAAPKDQWLAPHQIRVMLDATFPTAAPHKINTVSAQLSTLKAAGEVSHIRGLGYRR